MIKEIKGPSYTISDYYRSDIKFCYFKIDLSLTELCKYWTMNTVSSLSLNRLQSKTAKMAGLVLTDTFDFAKLQILKYHILPVAICLYSLTLPKMVDFPTK